MPKRQPSWTDRGHGCVRVVLSVALTAFALVVLTPATPAFAAAITLDKSAPAEVLVGDPIPYTLTATNPAVGGAAAEYNLSFRDVLPLGVVYTPGSTAPADSGEPTVITNGTTGQQTLVWRNVGDLGIGSSQTLRFSATASPAAAPVGTNVTNTASSYTHTNPRLVPSFTAAGAVVPGSYTQTATDSAATNVSAISIAKTEPSPEAELLRGVHDHPTVYTLRVTNNRVAATAGVLVTDYLPAGLEFLGCGGEDNGAGVEYAGAPRLTATPAVPDCQAPQSVTTVLNPAGYPAGVYTQVTWTLAAPLGLGEVRTLRYAAGIPQRENVLFQVPVPTPASGDQGANLDNNTGPTTRETTSERALTNRVRAQGTYTGPLATGASANVSAAATHTVTAEDVAVQKSAAPTTFVQGGVARYSLVVETSEYADASDLVLVDHLPNGLCPLSDTVSYLPGASDCAPAAAFAPDNATIAGVVQRPDGSWDITFSPLVLSASGTTTVAYSARMRATYTGGPQDGDPTSAEDGFTNEVALTARTVPPARVQAPDTSPQVVGDDSSATITSSGPSIDKTILPDVTPMDCGQNAYTNTPTPAEDTFTEGSRVCFQLRVDFPSAIDTRAPQVSDFLPVGVTYESGSMVYTSNNTVSGTFADTDGVPTWTLGSPGPGGALFIAPGSVFEARISGLVTTPATGPAPDLTANLMKFTYSREDGSTVSLRDDIDVRLAAPPPVSILKGVSDVNGVPGAGNPPNTDHRQVKAGDVVTFRVDVANGGVAANGTDVPVLGPDVWDVLPAGVTCALVTAVSDGGACTDPGNPAQPTFAGNGTRSAVRWQLPDTYTIAAGASRTLTYDMAVPAAASVSAVYANTAAVASYDTGTNRPGVAAEHLPASNIDTTAAPGAYDAPAASDVSDVFVSDVAVAKSGTTALTEAGNTAGQAVVGEPVTYTVSARVPPHTSVYNGRLTDPMPTGVTFLSAVAAYSATNVSPATGVLPVGVILDPLTGTLTFPATYANTTDDTQLFQVTITARVSTLAGNVHNVARVNTASFASSTAATGGTALPARTGPSTITVVAPAPSVTKTDDDADNIVLAGQQITYTLRAANTSGRPPLHDTWVVDCVPAALGFGAFAPAPTLPATAAAIPGTGINGCAVGTTRIAWNLPDLAGGASRTLSYTATVSPAAAGGDAYTNTVTLTGSTLADGKADPVAPDNPLERSFSASTSDVVTVAGSAISKSADPTTLTVGERGSWTVTASLPANVNFYDSAVTDSLPAGIDPDTLVTESATCTFAGGGACTIPNGAAALTPVAGPGGTTVVGWSLGDLTSDPTARVVTITYSAVVEDLPAVDRGDALTDRASLGWDLANGTDPTSAGATFGRSAGPAAATVTVLEPVLSLAKAVSDTTPGPGETFTYTVTATNLAGPSTSAAYGLTVTDAVPIGVVVDPAAISDGGTISGAGPNGGGTISWTVPGPIAPGAARALTYDAVLADSGSLTTAPLTNTADITGYDSLAAGGRHYDGPTATAAVTPVFPHVTPSKSVAPGPAYLGEPKTWTVRVTSDGQAPAYDVDVLDTLPEAWTYDAGSATVVVAGGAATQVEPVLGTSGGRTTLTWTDLGDLPVGTTLQVTYTATASRAVATSPGVGSTVAQTNTVATSADDAAGDDANASGAYAGPPATASTRIDAADVEVVKSHVGDAVPGQDLVWSLDVGNRGPDVAVGPFLVTDTLPNGLGATTATGTGWTCSVATDGVSCVRTDPTDTLGSGASFPPISVRAGIPSVTADGTAFTNSVRVDARTYDPDPTDNTDSDTVTAARAVDLAVDKELSGPLVAGQDATYTIAVTDNGPSDTEGPIVVTDPVPAGTTFVSASGTGWTCAEAGGDVTCTRDAGLGLGESAPQITLVVAVDEGLAVAVSNTASVDGPSPDPASGNDSDTVVTTPGQQADLGLQKASLGDFTAGDPGVYRFTVTNFGPSTARAPIRVTDTLPASLTYVSAAAVAGPWTCSATGQDLTCTSTGDLAVRDEAVVEVTVDVDPAQTGSIHNEATVSSTTPDPNPVNDTDGDDSDSDVQADLAVVKSHVGTATAGQDLTYTLAVRNDGPSDSSGPETVVDTLPDGLGYVSATGAGWTCNANAQVVTCERAAGIAAGTSAPDLLLVVAVAADAGPATLSNFASVDGPDSDPMPGNNTSIDPTVIDDSANIRLTKTATGADPVAAGRTTSFGIVVHNDGPSDADDVSVTDALPLGTTLVSASGPGWTCGDTSPVVCTRPTVAAGADAPTVTITVRIGSGVADGTTITNTATSSTGTPGDDPDDNGDDASVDVVTSADLAVVKTHVGDDPVAAGQQTDFRLAVTNQGPSDADAPVTIVDELPLGLTYVSAVGQGWTCASTDPDGREVTCQYAGSLAADTTAPDVILTVQIALDVDPQTLTNTATVSAATDDPDSADNTDTATVEVVNQADVSILKSHTGDPVVGQPLEFILQVGNAGPSEARDVVVRDTLPVGLTPVSAEGTDWTCTTAGQDVVCEHTGPVAPDPVGEPASAEPITVTVQVTPAAYPTVTNTATVETSSQDPDPTDDTSSDPIALAPLVDLSVVKRHVGGGLEVGTQATYDLAVDNDGPTADPGPVTVTDELPAGLTFVSGTGPGWTCEAPTGTVTCTRATGLGVGRTVTIRLVVAVGAAAYPSVSNTATVSSSAEDTDPANDASTDVAPVAPLVRLGVAKSLVSISAASARWRITVSNDGPNATVADVVAVDRLPVTLDYTSATGTGWTCAAVLRVVTCTFGGRLGVGDDASVVLTTAVVGGSTGQVRNTVSADTLGSTGRVSDEATGTIPDDGAGHHPGAGPDAGGPDDGLSPSGGSGGLPDTGGPALWLLLAGLVALGAGVALVRRNRGSD